MPADDIDLNLLTALDALLAEGSVSRAAQRLQLSDSAMSRTLGRLREATGDPLLVRAGRTMVPTPHALALRDQVRDLAQGARAVLQPARAAWDLRQLQRSFTLRANDGFIEAFGPTLVARAAREAPGVCLRFAPKPDKDVRPLREGLIDLDIGVLGESGPEVRLQALYRDRFVAAVRPGHPLLEGADGDTAAQASPHAVPHAAHHPVDRAVDRVVDDVADHTGDYATRYAACGHVVTSRRGRRAGPVDEALAARGLARRVAVVVPTFRAALSIAASTDLIALVPAMFFAQDLAVGALRALPLPVPTAPITVSQMWHPRMDRDPGHQWLRQLVLAACQEKLPP